MPAGAIAASSAALAAAGSRWSMGKRGVAVVPDPPERVDEAGSAGQIEGDEPVGHRGVHGIDRREHAERVLDGLGDVEHDAGRRTGAR